MIDPKILTFLTAAEQKSFTKAAKVLSLTQPAVSHHISLLEAEMNAPLFLRGRHELTLTREGEIVLKFAERMRALEEKMVEEIEDSKHRVQKIKVGITHTAESNLIVQVLAKIGTKNPGLNITIITDTINNLYRMLANFELDLAIVEGKNQSPDLNSTLLDTDKLVCVMSNENPLAKSPAITIGQLKKEKLILRLPSSATRRLFESTLESIGESIRSFDIAIEVDNIATIKDLVRKDFGVSILAESACEREIKKKSLTALPIENFSMIREINVVYHKTFSGSDILRDLVEEYRMLARDLD